MYYKFSGAYRLEGWNNYNECSICAFIALGYDLWFSGYKMI